MSHEFTSGLLAEPAWHGLGTVDATIATMPAKDAFVRAGALFPVEKEKLWRGPDAENVQLLEEGKAIIRPDTNKCLGIIRDQNWEVIPNTTLLRFAEMLKDDCTMNDVIVLAGGRRVAFTAKIKESSLSVVTNDHVEPFIVGYLGHDGKTGFGGMFTPVRVVCANTMGACQSHADRGRARQQFKISHTSNEINQIDDILAGIDMVRQEFPSVIEDYKLMAETEMDQDTWRAYLDHIYSADMKPVKTEDGNYRPGSITDMPRKFNALEAAWQNGFGSDIPGVKGSVWAGFNAVTEVESSTKRGKGSQKLGSALFGVGSNRIQLAKDKAMELACV